MVNSAIQSILSLGGRFIGVYDRVLLGHQGENDSTPFDLPSAFYYSRIV